MLILSRYLLILSLVMVLWETAVIKPIRVFAIFIHEIGHALAALSFGITSFRFKINFNGTEYIAFKPQSWIASFVIANAGYIASILFTILILYLKKTKLKKFLLGAFAILLLIVSIKFVGISWALVYSAVFAILVIILYMVQIEPIDSFIIDFIGLSCVGYVIYDTLVNSILNKFGIGTFIFGNNITNNYSVDISQLAKLTHMSTFTWGIIWLIISVVVVYLLIMKVSKHGTKTKGKA